MISENEYMKVEVISKKNDCLNNVSQSVMIRTQWWVYNSHNRKARSNNKRNRVMLNNSSMVMV